MILFLSSVALADELPCAHTDTPALHLVLWERRLPDDRDVPFGTHQQQMREELLVQLFGSDEVEPLAQDGDLISIFPEGFSRDDTTRRSRLPSASGHAQVFALLGESLAHTGDADPVDPVHAIAGSPVELSSAIQRSITGRMVEDYEGGPEAGHKGDSDNQRSVSHAGAKVHHAFTRALDHWGQLDAACNAPGRVTLTMVRTGNRSYAVDREASRVKDDLGFPAAAYYKHIRQDVYLLREVGTAFEKLTAYELDFRRHARAPELQWTVSGEPIHVDLRGRTRMELSQPLGSWRVELGDIDALSAHAQVLFRGRDAADVPIDWSEAGLQVASSERLLDTLLSEREELFGGADAAYLPELAAEIRLRRTSATAASLPAVALTEIRTVPAPEVSIALTPYRASEVATATGMAGTIATLCVLAWFVWTRKRRLDVDWAWEDDDIIDLAGIDGGSFDRDVRLLLRDASPLPARLARLKIRVTRRSFVQAQVPVVDHEGFQSLDAPGWTPTDTGYEMTINRPTEGATHDAPLTITTNHDRIDHARVAQLTEVIAGREALEVVVELAVHITDESPLSRYRDVEKSLYKVLRLKAVPVEPSPTLRLLLDSQCATRHQSLQAAPVVAGDAFAEVLLMNPPRDESSTLPVTWRLAGSGVRFRASDGTEHRSHAVIRTSDHEIDRDWSLEQTCSRKPARVFLALLHPEGLYAEDAPAQWTVDVVLRFTWQVAGADAVSVPDVRRRFRVQHEDLHYAACLDFGTSATRVLLQDPLQEAYGYLPLGDGLSGDAEDLPSDAFVTHDGRVVLAPEASAQDRDAGRYLDSIKGTVLSSMGSEERRRDLALIVSAILRQRVAPLLEGDEVQAIQPTATATERVRLSSRRRRLLVATLPNDADPLYRQALEVGIRRSGLLDRGAIMLLHEAEAVALWRASDIFGAPPPELKPLGPFVTILVVDYGAGTSDAAMVRVEPRKGWTQKVEVRSTGGARVGGRDVDVAFFDALCAASGKGYLSWASYAGDKAQLRLEMERAKIRVATGEAEFGEVLDYRLPVGDGHEDLNAELLALSTSQALDSVLHRMARLPLAVLLGRMPAGDRTLDTVDLVVLTGRAAQTPRLLDEVRAQVRALSSPGHAPHVEMAPPHLLKAAVTLGARRYALGTTGGFTPSQSVFRDRVVYLYRRPDGQAAAQVLLQAGQIAAGLAVEVTILRAESCRIIRTWMAPLPPGRVSDPERAWEMGQAEMRALLDREAISTIPGERPDHDVAWDPNAVAWTPRADGRIEGVLSIVIDSEHTVVVEPVDV
ncbi:MAG: hypothetical protein GY913_03635 [Proteobacteria bacterium]|nr:hypothetical protein [Pseudomonadota bacterium]MCP4915993.1 hypothetical protein [Pseudomonadota bacterium]